MKDEFGRVIIVEFVGLKSKMHPMKKIDGKECDTAKGVSIATDFNRFKDVLFSTEIISHKMKRIQSKRHKLGTYENNKIFFSCFDCKRYVLDDGFRMLAYFHKDSVTSCKEIKKIVIKNIIIKKIVIIETDCEKIYVSNKMNSVVM